MTSVIRASVATTIDRELPEVYAYLSDLSTMDDWVVGVSGTRLLVGTGGSVGDIYEYRYTYGGKIAEMHVEVTAIEPENRLAIESIAGPFPFKGELTLAEDGDGTFVTNTIEAGSDSRFTRVLFTVLTPIMRWVMKRRLRAELADLKEILEDVDEPSEQDLLDQEPSVSA